MGRWGIGLALCLAACGQDGAPETEAPPPKPLPELFVGAWANSFTDCSLAPGSAETAPVALTATQFIGLENSCTLTEIDVSDGGDAALATMTCRAEGELVTQTMDFRVKGDTLLASTDGGRAVTWTRCPISQSN